MTFEDWRDSNYYMRAEFGDCSVMIQKQGHDYKVATSVRATRYVDGEYRTVDEESEITLCDHQQADALYYMLGQLLKKA